MKKNRITALIISLSLVLIVALGAVSAFAKYIMKLGKQSELVSDNFYFTSDYLKADETPTYTLSENSVTFQARNYIDGLRINQADISYTVTVETAVEIRVGRIIDDGFVAPFEARSDITVAGIS